MDPKILMCIPTAEFSRYGIFHDYVRMISNPPIAGIISVHGQSPARGRNVPIQQAIDHDFTHIFFLDDDVLPPVDVIEKLLRHDVDMVSGLYLMRSYPHQPIAFSITNDDGRCGHFLPKENQTSGLVEIKTGGLGCALIKTSVFKAMSPELRERTKDNNDCQDWIKLGTPVTDVWCDDTGFFLHTNRLGFKLYLDLDVKCTHLGTVGIRPEFQNGRLIVCYDTNGTGSVAFPLPTSEEVDNVRNS